MWTGMITLPLQWLVIAACLVGGGSWSPRAAGNWLRGWRWRSSSGSAGPVAVRAIYVRPNEISIERPYIQQHIEATRSAFGLDRRLTETEFAAKLDGRFDPAKNQALLQNVRLWDWRAFRDTVTQIQALRPYYTFADTDVDRYTIDGQLRQVLLTPRELDIRQLPDARTRWINPHFIYTHGYGLVMAEANRITAGRSSAALHSGCSRRSEDAEPEIDASRTLLRGGDSRAGLRAHGAARIQLSFRRG